MLLGRPYSRYRRVSRSATGRRPRADFVDFRGFLGTKMSLQYIWQGCDSILAAPLVLDQEFAQRQGEAGPMTHLACFFKDPLGVGEYSFAEQFRLLTDYVTRNTHNGRHAKRKPRRR